MGCMALGLGAVFNVTFTTLAGTYDVSKEVLMGWKSRRRPWFARFLRSTKPVRIQMGSYFYADKELVLTSMGIMADNSVTLMVSRS